MVLRASESPGVRLGLWTSEWEGTWEAVGCLRPAWKRWARGGEEDIEKAAYEMEVPWDWDLGVEPEVLQQKLKAGGASPPPLPLGDPKCPFLPMSHPLPLKTHPCVFSQGPL